MTTERALIIVNPAAKHGVTGSMLPMIEQLLTDLPHDTVVSDSPNHSVELARCAADYTSVVAVGGDGAMHDVLNGLMQIPAEQRPKSGLLPTGSGNDTARSLGIGSDLTAAALTLLEGVSRRFDVGVCNGSYFNNSFAVGLDAKVTAKAIELKATKHRSGFDLYLSAVLDVLRHDLDSHRLRIVFDDGPEQEYDVLALAMMVGRTYGGGFRITPDADPHDGLFDVCRIDPLSFSGAVLRLPLLAVGRHTKMKPVHMSRHVSAVIDSDVPVPAQVDGEVLLREHYEISTLPDAIECIVPRSSL